MAITKEQAIGILDKFDFFQGQRAGRELWNDKPYEVQEEDINTFARDCALLKEYIADVVPKSEYDAVVSAVDNSTQEFLRLHDDYQEAKRDVDRLNAVMKDMDEQRAYTINMLGESLENAKSEIEMLQGALKAEEQHNELTMEMAQKALKNARAEVVREIFEEIECVIRKHDERPKYSLMIELAELKKKYTEEQI